MQRFISTLLTLSSLAAYPALAAEKITLNNHILLQGDVLTVGDVFAGVQVNSKQVLAPAPEVGAELVLSANDLQRIASTLHLDWKAENADVSATVERDAMLLDKDTIVGALNDSDLPLKIDAGAEIALLQPAAGIVVPGHEAPLLTITDIAYDPLSQKFTAVVLSSRERKIINKTTIAGIATKMTDVPVLTAMIERGAIVGASDVTTIRLPSKSVKFGLADKVEDVVGMAAKRNIKANEPIDKASLMAPVLVRRNEIVTVTYRNGPITLSTKARALANAARGETVQLENPASKKLIEAVVTGPQQTTVHMDTTVVVNG